MNTAEDLTTATNKLAMLTNDLCFKYVFSKKHILEDFINSFFEYINSLDEFQFTEITPENYIMPDNKELSLYFGDIVSTSKQDTLISLEMYKDPFDIEGYIKSKAYMCRLFDQNIKKNDYKKAKRVFSINLIKGNFKRANNDLVNEYTFSNKINHKDIDNGFTIMYLIRFDKVKNIPYNEDEQRFITWLRLINAKDLAEIKQYIRKDDEIMSEIEKFVADWNRKSAKNGLEKYIEETAQKAKKDGIYEGISQGISEGISQGILQTAKNLLSLNISINDIKKATGLSEKELKNLKEQIN